MSDVNYEILTRRFPREAIKQRKGGNGMMLNYLETHTVIRRLIEATGNNFNFRVLGIDIADNLVMATIELEIGGSRRQQVGTQRMNGGNNDDAQKAAISDGLKKCASLFGVGLELWGQEYEADMPTQTARPAQSQNGGNGNGKREPVAASETNTRRMGFRPRQDD